MPPKSPTSSSTRPSSVAPENKGLGLTRPRVLRLSAQQWRYEEQTHQARADAFSQGHRTRRGRQEQHPVEDFLWTYYSVSPAQLRRWHPGSGVMLADGAAVRSSWRYYSSRAGVTRAPGEVAVDLSAYFAARGSTVDYIERLLRSTLSRPAAVGCFGMHEWAMVYRHSPEQLRHRALPLRLSTAETDAVVESQPISCSHFDAYRFFTPEAVPRNRLRPTRATQPEMEQPGCLHAGMDIYKWAAKLGPIVPGELLLDAFELARDIREVDMRASPYDVSGITGSRDEPLQAIPVESAEGRAQYAALQRNFADRGNILRRRLLDAIDRARVFA